MLNVEKTVDTHPGKTAISDYFMGQFCFFKPLNVFSFSLSNGNYQTVATKSLSTAATFRLNYFVINYMVRISLC